MSRPLRNPAAGSGDGSGDGPGPAAPRGARRAALAARLRGWSLFPAVPVQHRAFLAPGRLAGPMPWVIAIVATLALLATAAGLGLARLASGIDGAVASRLTVQLTDPDPVQRQARARVIATDAARMEGVTAVRIVPDRELRALVGRWFGAAPGGGAEGAGDAGAALVDPALPMPALVDIDLVAAGDGATRARLDRLVADRAPGATILAHAEWLGPVAGLAGGLAVLAFAIVALMAAALVATVMLTVRQALGVHGQTIAILSLMGATDAQVARLFQWRIVRDSAFGVAVGTLGALLILLAVRWSLAGVGAGLLRPGQGSGGGDATRAGVDALVLLALPLATIALGALAARLSLVRALERRS